MRGKQFGRIVALTVTAIFLTLARPAGAQTDALVLQQVNVSLWPDYDRPQMLVIVDGELPPTIVLPAVVTLPLPAGVSLNAVAHEADGSLRTVPDFSVDEGLGTITLTSPTARFRVEYYAPYTVNGDNRQYDFIWKATTDVMQLAVAVQQPAAARDLTLSLPAISRSGNDSLTYYDVAPQKVAAGQSYQLSVSYNLTSAALTVGSNADQTPVGASAATPSADKGVSDWVLAGGVLILALAIALTGWQLSRRRAPARVLRPRPQSRQSAPAEPTAGFCRQCGAPLRVGDRFCGKCGAPL